MKKVRTLCHCRGQNLTLAQSLCSFQTAPPRSIYLISSIHIGYRNTICVHSKCLYTVISQLLEVRRDRKQSAVAP